MGDDPIGSQGVATLPASGLTPATDESEPITPPADDPGDTAQRAGARRRFTVASVLGVTVGAVPFLWILWSLWGSPSILRRTAYENNFYELQARALIHGHLWLANGSIGIEAFVHGGRQYTYFGLFSSLIRMPILLITSALDGKLGGPFILVAWLLTALFSSLLLWRVRILVRGPVAMGLTEAAAFGVLMATFMSGTVFLYLAATPYVFAEDLAWSVCLTVASFFTLLGVLERPTWGRVVASFLLVLSANLDRVTTGWACVVAAVLMAVWFGIGRGGPDNRRWWLPVLAVGLVPLAIGCAINFAKFGVPFGVSNFDQVWTHVNAYRRTFLAANHNSEYGTAFIPSTLLAYLRPDGLRITSIFPFITLPAAPPSALSGVLFDRRYRTASLPASVMLLFLLSCWGLVTAFRPRPVGRVALTRILLIAGVIAASALFIWGYIAPRYLADFIPLLVLASAVAMVDIWRRLAGGRRWARRTALVVMALLGLFTVAANIGMAITPNEEWSSTQVLRYVETQKAISDISGHSLNARVTRGTSLPPWGPADQLYVIGRCQAMYISNGEDYSTVPAQQFTRTTWMTVELGHAFQHTFAVTVERGGSTASESVPLLSVGRNVVTIRAQSAAGPYVRVSFQLEGPGGFVGQEVATLPRGSLRRAVIVTDPEKHLVQVTMGGLIYLSTTLDAIEPVVVGPPSGQPGGLLSVVNVTAASPQPTLCQSLTG